MSCFILQQENLTSDLKSYEVGLRKRFYFTKVKVDQKFLSFGPKSSYLGTHVKDKGNKKTKAIVIIHVCNEFDI